MEVTSDPPEATVFVNGNQRGTTPFRYVYDPVDGRELNFELRKSGYTPSTFVLRPHMDNGVLFVDAMLLGVPYIIDRKNPALYALPMDRYTANLYKEVPGDIQRQLVPITNMIVALGD